MFLASTPLSYRFGSVVTERSRGAQLPKLRPLFDSVQGAKGAQSFFV